MNDMNKNKIHKTNGWGSTKCGIGYLHEKGSFSPRSGLWKDVTCKSCLKFGKRRRHNDL